MQDAMRSVVLVNGVPASGKSTVVTALRREIPAANVYEMDVIKEAFMDVFGRFEGEDSLRLSRASSAAIWKLIGASAPRSLSIVDCWIQESERQKVSAALAKCGVSHVVEVWCEASPDIVIARYVERVARRHAGHLGTEFAPQLQEIAAAATPVGLGVLVRINTETDNLQTITNHVAKLVESDQGLLSESI